LLVWPFNWVWSMAYLINKEWVGNAQGCPV
jgi:hypothetical protein